MAIRKDEGFVLARIPFRETSILLTVFSQNSGKLKLLMKGVRNDKRSKLARFEPFTHVSFVYYEKIKSDLHLGTDMEILNSQSSLRSQIAFVSYASYLTELVDTLFHVHDPCRDAYELLRYSFKSLSDGAPETVVRVFELKVLAEIGWLPTLTKCVSCAEQVNQLAYFSPRQGGIICPKCEPKDVSTFPISRGARETLLYFVTSKFQDAIRLKISVSIGQELKRISEKFFRFHLDYPLRSTKFLSEVAPFPTT
jgi:DNA repair protein RecO (recombination protein O)